MKKIKEPQLKVIKFKAMDVIATSGEQVSPGKANLQGMTFVSNVSGQQDVLDWGW